MSTSIDQAFISQFEVEVHHAYQRMGSLIRGTVRTKNNIKGEKTRFQKVGKGTATTKGPNSQISVMNLGHSNVDCFLTDFYASDWSDMLDEMKTNIDERQILSDAGAYALGRTTDDLILQSLYQGTDLVPIGGVGLTRAKINTALAKLLRKDVKLDGQIFCALPPTAYVDLFNIEEFTSQDYVGGNPLKQMGYQVDGWSGVNWYEHSGLRQVGTTATAVMYHKSAVGHAIGQEVKSDITWHGDRASHFVSNSMSMGSCVIDDEGIVLIDLLEPIA